MNFYAENNNVGLTRGQISFAQGQEESAAILLEIDKHPAGVQPTVVATPQGTLANVRTYATVDFSAGVWQLTVRLSNGVVEAGGLIKVDYTVLSTWAN